MKQTVEKTVIESSNVDICQYDKQSSLQVANNNVPLFFATLNMYVMQQF